MSIETTKPLRADAARNRQLVLKAALDTFASEGLGVPLDEIARRAGVGAGTIYRHFPTKDDLFRAVIGSLLADIVADGRAMLHEPEPGEALFRFLRLLILHWGADNQGLVDAFATVGLDWGSAGPVAEEEFLVLLGDLLRAAQDAGNARAEITPLEVKTLMIGCQAMQGYNAALAESVTEVVLNGMRPRSA
ncbi:TetR/AcrR family transcriptional regulator [Frondihabitans cladoniiphilus]|uniref:TetR/AcrR family transcriptional regulator n=1 Tax=Frondihabitans cladoniiphilus TaxID=715785 RepID=A0ABP8WAD3_9MICO